MLLRFSLLAVAFLLACTGVERDNPYDEGGNNYGEWDDDKPKQCDDCNFYENIEKIEFKFTDQRDKKVYKAVEIKIRKSIYDNKDGHWIADDDSVYKNITWMVQNLNFNAPGSVCYNKNEANCTTYGRLYNFETADGAYHCKARWLGLGGLGNSKDDFSDLDSTGYWWTSTDGKAGNAYSLHGKMEESTSTYEDGTKITESYPYLRKGLDDKNSLLSIRCVQD